MTQKEMDTYYADVAALHKPICKECKHAYVNHLIPFTFELRKYKAPTLKSHTKDGCSWSAGAWDAGCSCTGYRS